MYAFTAVGTEDPLSFAFWWFCVSWSLPSSLPVHPGGSVAFSTDEVSLLSLGVSSPVDHAPQVSRMGVASGTGAP